MNLSIWRYSHLVLAVSSCIFLVLAAISGVILSFEPAVEKLNRPSQPSLQQITLAESIPVWKQQFPSISEVTIDDFQSVVAKSADFPKDVKTAYIHPKTGLFLGASQPQNAFFEWVTAFHRSLFLHELGRFFVGLTAFLLLLITTSGLFLLIQRQSGIKNLFKRIPNDASAQYFHVVLSRWSFIPIVLIAITGTYLALVRFEVFVNPKVSLDVDFDAIKTAPQKPIKDFTVFKNINLADVKKVEFPFSEDPEDYFTIQLKDKEIAVNQITGDILAQQNYPFTQVMSTLSLDLHTGRSNWLWALVLMIASGNILFFIVSGFMITFKRIAGKTKNRFTAEESRFVILVGSENGGTWTFANSVHQQLLKQGEKSFISSLNQFQAYPQAEHLLVFTATYGIGEAPSNANHFKDLLDKITQQQAIQFSVIGFGSRAYPDFCQFAYQVHHWLNTQTWAKPLVDIHTINDKSEEEYALWTEAWTAQTGIQLTTKIALEEKNSLQTLEVVSNTAHSNEETFLLKLQAGSWTKVKSGDLLAIYPANDHRERLYSIGITGKKQVQLSVRLHPNGLGSSYLHQLKVGEKMQAKIIANTHFHFPKKAPEVMMICNGTGIAPFLGMIHQNKKQVPCHLYAGFRDKNAWNLYQSQLENTENASKVHSIQLAFSREENKQYVGDLIKKDAEKVALVLKKGGVVMLCGSLAMQKDVMFLLENICQKELNQPLSYFQAHQQIRSDCY